MEGWIALHRSLAFHELWTSEPFTRGQALVDMLMLANHAPGIIRKQGLRIDLDRGDVGWSECELAERWKWSRGKVRRFLDELKTDHMITRKTAQADGEKQDKRKFVITIVNYDKFQSTENTCGTSDGTGNETSDGQATVQATDKRRYKNNNGNNENNGKNEDNIPHGAADAADKFYLTKKKRKLTGKRLETFNRFWEAFSYFKGKAEAADSWLDIPTLTDSLVETIVAAARSEAKRRPDAIAQGRTPKMAQGWLTARRWEDVDFIPTAVTKSFTEQMRAMCAIN